MNVDRAKLKRRLGRPAVALVVGLVVSTVLMLLPAGPTAAIKGAAARLLRPGQVAALAARQHGGRLVGEVRDRVRTSVELTRAKEEIQRLQQENHRLLAELAARQGQPAESSGEQADDVAAALLRPRCLKARVLGQQAMAFLGRQPLLDVGSRAGVQPDALVLDVPPGVIDRGDDAQLKIGQLVLSRGRVWGKVVEVGPHTSVVRTVTQPGYRDLVRLAGPSGKEGGRRRGPQGILEGTGEPLGRIRLIEVTEPVSVGDPVYTAAGKGLLPAPLLYGSVVRLERPVGAAHWEIWMQPAVEPDQPEHVAVLRAELNPLRVSSGQRAAGSRQ